jgi:predicted RNA-binding protein YlxR (DUF448 family)
MVKACRAVGASPAVSPKQRSGRGSQPRKHIPVRTCIACQRTGSKRELIRVVRTPAAGVQVDASGKLAGRGAYLCQNRTCWERGLRSQRLSQALKTALTAEEIATLRAFAMTLPEMSTVGKEPAPSGEAAPSSDHA